MIHLILRIKNISLKIKPRNYNILSEEKSRMFNSKTFINQQFFFRILTPSQHLLMVFFFFSITLFMKEPSVFQWKFQIHLPHGSFMKKSPMKYVHSVKLNIQSAILLKMTLCGCFPRTTRNMHVLLQLLCRLPVSNHFCVIAFLT